MLYSDAGLLDVCVACSRGMKEEKLGKALDRRLKAVSSGGRGPYPCLYLLRFSCPQV